MKTSAMKRILPVTALVVALAAPWMGACAQGGTMAEKDSQSSRYAANGKTAGSGFTEAEVRKVDKDAGKITLKHGPITNLDMPPMTMVFRAKDPKMLDNVKAGDKVRVKVDKIQGAYTVTEIEPAR